MPAAEAERDSTAMLTVSPSDGVKGIISFSRLEFEPKEVERCGILLETMQLVAPEPARQRLPVPNHILNTKIYKKVKKNDQFSVQPTVVHFAGFEPQCIYKQKLDLVNTSTDIQRMHVIPPQTKYFNIKYTKNHRMLPGLVVTCVVEFFPDEWRYYYDCIRIHCQNNDNLVIPIHGYPVLNTSEFPQSINFASVPVGETKTKVIPLRCQAPVNFEFCLTYVQPHPSYKIDPLSGIVPANGEVDISVSFTPTQFCSATMKFQLEISQFMAKPLLCTVNGHSQPGLARDILLKSENSFLLSNKDCLVQMFDPSSISPLDRARSNKLKEKSPRMSSLHGDVREVTTKEIEHDGLQIPTNLDSPYSVALVLNQKRGKRRLKDILQQAKDKNPKTLTRQMKETTFELLIRQNIYDERQNQLKWQIKVGDEPVTKEFCSELLVGRNHDLLTYKMLRGDPDEDEEIQRFQSELIFRKTRRDACSVAPDVATFDAFTNDMWIRRHETIGRFQQAARKVIIRRRVEPRLMALKQLVLMHSSPTTNIGCDLPELHEKPIDKPVIVASRIRSITFPTYVAPDVSDDLAVDALGQMLLKPVEIKLVEKVPYFALQVPRQYELLGYRTHSVQDASFGYPSRMLVRTLRTGAEDEVISLLPPLPPPCADVSKLMGEISGKVTDPQEECSEVVTLTLPSALVKPFAYPPLHIFNPEPAMQTFMQSMPYSELDAEFHVCALPRFAYPDSSNQHWVTQKKYLDREEVIKGVMTWKQFPSSTLTHLVNAVTLSSVWVPRWTDPFKSDLLPVTTPMLFDCLEEDDMYNINENEAPENACGLNIELTMEMVKAEFAGMDLSFASATEISSKEKEPAPPVKPKSPHTNLKEPQFPKEEILIFPFSENIPACNLAISNDGLIPRDRREAELEYFLQKKQNLLGKRISEQVQHLNSQKINTKLILK